MSSKFPSRIHVLLPRSGTTAVVIRRGPSKRTGVFAWNTQTDEVRVSQWLAGRIYERRSDISPDGKYWIYFAMNGRWGSRAKGSWTAIARAPWLKAVAFFPKGDCWNGGGLFVDNRLYWLNDGYGHENFLDTHEVKRASAPPSGLKYFGGECLTVYYNRLMRDGWVNTGRSENGRHDAAMFFEKQLPNGWTLRKICHEQIGAPRGKGCYWDEHVTVSENGGETAHPDWEWAERLGDDIVYAEGGCLFRQTVNKRGTPGREGLVHDLNDYEFEALEAPY